MLLVDIISDLISAISTDKRWFELVSTIILQSLTKVCGSKVYGRQPLRNFAWSILEYLDPFVPTNARNSY